MINLLPNEEKKKMVQDFYFRLASVCLLMLSASALAASTALLPSYFLSASESRFAREKLAIQQNNPLPLSDQDTLAEVAEIENRLDILEKARRTRASFVREIVNEVALEKSVGIRITGISYREDPPARRSVRINGVAKDRNTLSAFRRALEENPSFTKVDLPISNFVKDSNIHFYIDLIPS